MSDCPPAGDTTQPTDSVEAVAEAIREADQRWWWAAEPESPHEDRYRCMAIAAIAALDKAGAP